MAIDFSKLNDPVLMAERQAQREKESQELEEKDQQIRDMLNRCLDAEVSYRSPGIADLEVRSVALHRYIACAVARARSASRAGAKKRPAIRFWGTDWRLHSRCHANMNKPSQFQSGAVLGWVGYWSQIDSLLCTLSIMSVMPVGKPSSESLPP